MRCLMGHDEEVRAGADPPSFGNRMEDVGLAWLEAVGLEEEEGATAEDMQGQTSYRVPIVRSRNIEINAHCLLDCYNY